MPAGERRRQGVLRRATALRVLVADERGRRVSAPGVARWLARVAPARARGVVSVALVGDARVRALNREFRGVDRTTDVLSFPAHSTSPPQRIRGTRPSTGSGRAPLMVSLSNHASSVTSVVESLLGDIVIARGVARRQARAAGHSELTELRVLALHGLLHLLGYDHERDNGRMLDAERRLRRKGGLPEGLIERTGTRIGRGSLERLRAAKRSSNRAGGGAPAQLKNVGPRAIK